MSLHAAASYAQNPTGQYKDQARQHQDMYYSEAHRQQKLKHCFVQSSLRAAIEILNLPVGSVKRGVRIRLLNEKLPLIKGFSHIQSLPKTIEAGETLIAVLKEIKRTQKKSKSICERVADGFSRFSKQYSAKAALVFGALTLVTGNPVVGALAAASVGAWVGPKI